MSEPRYVTEARAKHLAAPDDRHRPEYRDALARWQAGEREPGDDPHPEEATL